MENNKQVIDKIQKMDLSPGAVNQIHKILNSEELRIIREKNQNEFVSFFLEKVLIPARMIPILHDSRNSTLGIQYLREWWEEVRVVHDHPTKEDECRDSMGIGDARAILKALFNNDAM